MLTRLIVPGTAYWTEIENKPRNAVSGMYQRLPGVKNGFPDLMVLRTAKPPIFIEMKSQTGTLSSVQVDGQTPGSQALAASGQAGAAACPREQAERRGHPQFRPALTPRASSVS